MMDIVIILIICVIIILYTILTYNSYNPDEGDMCDRCGYIFESSYMVHEGYCSVCTYERFKERK